MPSICVCLTACVVGLPPASHPVQHCLALCVAAQVGPKVQVLARVSAVPSSAARRCLLAQQDEQDKAAVAGEGK